MYDCVTGRKMKGLQVSSFPSVVIWVTKSMSMSGVHSCRRNGARQNPPNALPPQSTAHAGVLKEYPWTFLLAVFIAKALWLNRFWFDQSSVAGRRADLSRAVIVCPKTLVLNWTRELKKW